jgi:hypothetical protein
MVQHILDGADTSAAAMHAEIVDQYRQASLPGAGRRIRAGGRGRGWNRVGRARVQALG